MQDFGMKSVMEKFIPWLLLPEEKEHHATVANDSIQTATSEPDTLQKVITRDESWVHGYDLETKAQRSPWKSFWFSMPEAAWQRYGKGAARSRPCCVF